VIILQTMKRLLSISIVLMLIACQAQQNVDVQPSPSDPADDVEAPIVEWVFGEPVEQLPQLTPYGPNFENQLRAPGMITQQAYHVETLDVSLVAPWSIKIAPNGTFFITERAGNLVVLNPDLSITRIRIPVQLERANQGGLLDLVLAADFTRSRTLYFSLSVSRSNGSTTALARAVLTPDLNDFVSFDVLFEARPMVRSELHYGARLVLMPDNTLLMSIGDRNSNRSLIQDLTTHLGKVLHLDQNGTLINHPDYPAPGIFALGLRNPQGLIQDPRTQELFASDMGPRSGDEINQMVAGGNYGWPIISHGLEYNGQPVGSGLSQRDGYLQPRYVWDPAVAPSGMAIYAHNAMAEWENDLLIAALRGRHLIRLKRQGDRIIGEERLLSNLEQRLRDVTVSDSGWVYVISDEGYLHRLRPYE
jgi:glucose/arabinose dehydrogenase